MKFNACFLFLLLSVTLIRANPALKTTEKKSLTEESKAEATKENLKIEETGEDKDRSKKAALCLQIEPISPQTAQIALNEHQLGLQNIPLAVQTQSIPQQVQSLSVVQPVASSLSQANIVVPQQMIQHFPQSLSQANIVLPQQIVNPVHTLRIVQPAIQPCAQSAPSVNIIQSTPQNKVSQTAQKPKPKPTATHIKETEPVKELSKPMRIEKQPLPLPAPQETLSVMPVVPTFQQEQMMLIPETEEATFIQIPSHPICSNPLHGLMTECTCQKMDSSALNMMPVASYPATYASMTVPHMVASQVKLGPQARTKTYVNVNIPHSHSYQQPYTPQQPVYHQNTYMEGLNSAMNPYGMNDMVDNSYASKTSLPSLTINAFPHSYRAANSIPQSEFSENSLRNKQEVQASPMSSEIREFLTSNKVPRETDPDQLSPEKTQIKQDEGRAMLIDGRRNARSNKEEAKVQKKQM
ncbi:unnamed protein product [Xylocopa violacea]|uniref:Uncharacterized protein n=1 Tax=Xylocopa violacea TaxID=135666 RepID=A0ABP1NN00_XYLVO